MKEFFYEKWTKEWEDYPCARMGKQFYSRPCANKAKYVYKLSRAELTRFIKIISGHNGLFYFKNKVDPEINSICRFCLEDDETFYHFITNCPVMRLSRQDILLDKDITNDMDWSVRDLLLFSHKPGVQEALNGETGLDFYENLHQHETLESSVSDDGG